MSASVHAGIHPPPPRPVHAGTDIAPAADGTHPTGMHSYLGEKFPNGNGTLHCSGDDDGYSDVTL